MAGEDDRLHQPPQARATAVFSVTSPFRSCLSSSHVSLPVKTFPPFSLAQWQSRHGGSHGAVAVTARWQSRYHLKTVPSYKSFQKHISVARPYRHPRNTCIELGPGEADEVGDRCIADTTDHLHPGEADKGGASTAGPRRGKPSHEL